MSFLRLGHTLILTSKKMRGDSCFTAICRQVKDMQIALQPLHVVNRHQLLAGPWPSPAAPWPLGSPADRGHLPWALMEDKIKGLALHPGEHASRVWSPQVTRWPHNPGDRGRSRFRLCDLPLTWHLESRRAGGITSGTTQEPFQKAAREIWDALCHGEARESLVCCSSCQKLLLFPTGASCVL